MRVLTKQLGGKIEGEKGVRPRHNFFVCNSGEGGPGPPYEALELGTGALDSLAVHSMFMEECSMDPHKYLGHCR